MSLRYDYREAPGQEPGAIRASDRDLRARVEWGSAHYGQSRFAKAVTGPEQVTGGYEHATSAIPRSNRRSSCRSDNTVVALRFDAISTRGH